MLESGSSEMREGLLEADRWGLLDQAEVGERDSCLRGT